jgi:hypothetical protein
VAGAATAATAATVATVAPGDGPASAVAAAEATTRAAPLLAPLEWLAGCWEARSATRVVLEAWMRPEGGCMLGMSRTVRGDSLLEYELVLLRDEEGLLVYEAHPSGQSPARFPATAISDTLLLFEDPQHDFPQRIAYRRASADSLVARVSGTIDGKERAVEFAYRRVPCEAAR